MMGETPSTRRAKSLNVRTARASEIVRWHLNRFRRIAPLALLLIAGWSLEAVAQVPSSGSALAAAESAPPAMGRLAGMITVLVIIVGVIIVGGFLLRRLRNIVPGPAGGMQVRGHLALGPKERIVLVQAGGTQLLVGLTPGRLHTLHVLDTPLEAGAETDSAGSGFAGRLRAVMARNGS